MSTVELTFPKRPIGVWILTILNIFFSGIYSAIKAIAFVFVRGNISLISLAMFLAVLQFTLGLAIIWVSIKAWQGKTFYRIKLLQLLVGIHSLQIVSNVFVLMSGSVPTQLISWFAGTIVFSIFWIAINLWYFHQSNVLDWFQRVENNNS